MKKTITLLLAATSVAMAKTTDVTDLLVWDENNTTASLVGAGFTNSDITVVLTLNWKNLDSNLVAHDILTVSGDSGYCLGLGMNYAWEPNGELTCIYSQDGSATYQDSAPGSYQWVNQSAVVNAAIVFSAGLSTVPESRPNPETGDIETVDVPMYVLTGTLYRWNGVDEEPITMTVNYNVSPDDVLGLDLTSLTLGPNAIVDKAAVYTGITDNSLALAKDLLGLSTPEPTTATLSLLALAGLAARRRRH